MQSYDILKLCFVSRSDSAYFSFYFSFSNIFLICVSFFTLSDKIAYWNDCPKTKSIYHTLDYYNYSTQKLDQHVYIVSSYHARLFLVSMDQKKSYQTYLFFFRENEHGQLLFQLIFRLLILCNDQLSVTVLVNR